MSILESLTALVRKAAKSSKVTLRNKITGAKFTYPVACDAPTVEEIGQKIAELDAETGYSLPKVHKDADNEATEKGKLAPKEAPEVYSFLSYANRIKREAEEAAKEEQKRERKSASASASEGAATEAHATEGNGQS